MTFLLRDSFGGNSKTCLVATVSPSSSSLSETLSTLNFAQGAKLIRNRAILNEDTCGTVASLQAEVCRLRGELRQAAELSSSSSARVGISSSKLPPKPTLKGRVYENNATNIQRNDIDIIMLTLRRKAKQAEDKAAALNRQVSEKNKIVQSLKRKLDEETLVRKLKQRRIDFLSQQDSAGDHDAEVSSLSREIESLRRQLDAPSADAIEWKVAYDQLREKMLKKMSNGDGVECDSNREEKEAVIGRLLEEKIALEEKLAESTTSTREEFDMVFKEVERLEKEIVFLKKKLQDEEDNSREAQSRASLVEKENIFFQEELASARQNRENAERAFQAELEANGELESEIVRLINEMEKKSDLLADAEAKRISIENELKSKLEDFIKQLEESNSKLERSQNVELELRKDMKLGTEKNSKLLKDFEDGCIKNDRLKARVDELEVVLKTTEKEKLSIEKEKDALEESLTEKISELERLQQKHLEQELKLGKIAEKLDCEKGKVEQLNMTIAQLDKDMKINLEQSSQVQREAKEMFEAKIRSHEVEREKLLTNMTSIENNTKYLASEKCKAEEMVKIMRQVEIEKDAVLKRAREEKDDLHSEMREQVNILKTELQAMADKEKLQENEKRKVEELKTYIDQLEVEKAVALNESKEIKETEALLNAKLDSLKAECSSLEAKNSHLEKIESTLIKERDRSSDLECVIKRLEVENADILSKVVSEKNEMEITLKEKIESVQLEREDVLCEVASLKMTVESLQKEKENANALAEKCKQLEKEKVEALGKATKEMENVQMRMKEEINALKKNEDTFREEQKLWIEQKKKLEYLEDLVEDLKKEKVIALDKLTKESEFTEAAMKTRICALEAERTTLLAKILSSEKMAAELKSEQEKSTILSRTIEKLEDEKSKVLTSALDEYKRQQTSFNERVNKMEKERQSLLEGNAKINRISKELDHQKHEVLNLMKINERLREKILLFEQNKEKQLNVEHLKSEIRFLENEKNMSSKKLLMLESTSKEERKKVDLLKDQLKLVKKARDSLQHELSSCQSDHENLLKRSEGLEKTNYELQNENKKLKEMLEGQKVGAEGICGDMDESDNLGTRSNTVSTLLSRNGGGLKCPTLLDRSDLTCQHSDSPGEVPFSDLSEQMDNVLNRLSTGNSCKTESTDDSFDESMFLPNVEDSINEKENSIPASLIETSLKREKVFDKDTTSPHKMPSKKKRYPLSARSENTTPHEPSSVKNYTSFTAFRSGW
uniref:Kinesin motor domain-containing protein n=3 Tax=Ditylum brightwellii TaxID=49249 RepID=A0A7S4RWN8_9STRA